MGDVTTDAVSFQCYFDGTNAHHVVHVPVAADGSDLRVCDLRRAIKQRLGDRCTCPAYDIAVAPRCGRRDGADARCWASGTAALDHGVRYDFRAGLSMLEAAPTTMAAQAEVPSTATAMAVLARRCRCRRPSPTRPSSCGATLTRVFAATTAVATVYQQRLSLLLHQAIVAHMQRDVAEKAAVAADDDDDDKEAVVVEAPQVHVLVAPAAGAAHRARIAPARRSQARFWLVKLRALHKYIATGVHKKPRRTFN
jgi:hypothetical protein